MQPRTIGMFAAIFLAWASLAQAAYADPVTGQMRSVTFANASYPLPDNWVNWTAKKCTDQKQCGFLASGQNWLQCVGDCGKAKGAGFDLNYFCADSIRAGYLTETCLNRLKSDYGLDLKKAADDSKIPEQLTKQGDKEGEQFLLLSFDNEAGAAPGASGQGGLISRNAVRAMSGPGGPGAYNNPGGGASSNDAKYGSGQDSTGYGQLVGQFVSSNDPGKIAETHIDNNPYLSLLAAKKSGYDIGRSPATVLNWNAVKANTAAAMRAKDAGGSDGRQYFDGMPAALPPESSVQERQGNSNIFGIGGSEDKK